MRIRYVALAAATAAIALLFSASPAHADPSLDEVKEQVKEKGEELEKVIEQYNGAKEKLKKAEKRQKEIEKTLGPLAEQVTLAQEEIDAIASSTYTGGNLSQVNIMLSGSPDETIQRLSLLSQLGQTQVAEIRAFNEANEEFRAEQESLEATIKEQEDLKKEIGEKKDKIEGELDDLKAMQDELEPDYGVGKPPPPSGRAGEAVSFAYDQIGDPYQYGAGGPNSWDCSGLTQGAWGAAGVSLSHNTNMQWNEVPHVSRSQLAAGDLVFYNDLNHVAIYAGDNVIVHAPTAGQNVTTAPLDSMPIVGFGRPS
ncbi:MAG TPA: NlpC/P60 family protein [Phytomonospora sp.]